jgi:hypothetical protein
MGYWLKAKELLYQIASAMAISTFSLRWRFLSKEKVALFVKLLYFLRFPDTKIHLFK